jgi:thiol-disulfide isomerase/thioredoxin
LIVACHIAFLRWPNMQRLPFIAKLSMAAFGLASLGLANIATRTGLSDDSEALSSLVGKPAPDFQLQLLAGTRFHLAEAKDKVVVLDFWATWCGACRQAMPEVERVVEEFKGRNVQFVAVDLRENQDQITAALPDIQPPPAIALDADGRVADLYRVTGIPQTVVIDRRGTVAQCFVGAAPGLAGSLRNAVQEALSAGEPTAAKAPNLSSTGMKARF